MLAAIYLITGVLGAFAGVNQYLYPPTITVIIPFTVLVPLLPNIVVAIIITVSSVTVNLVASVIPIILSILTYAIACGLAGYFAITHASHNAYTHVKYSIFHCVIVMTISVLGAFACL